VHSRRARGSTSDPQLADRRDRWRRWLLSGQGAYYVLTGVWPLVHFPSFADAVALRINPFQAQSFAAVIIVVGGSLIEAARREPPGPFPTMLGAATAAAIALISLWWLPRLGTASILWIDVLVEVAFAVFLVLLYPRAQADRARTTTRRR
jgi:hypothetical protein